MIECPVDSAEDCGVSEYLWYALTENHGARSGSHQKRGLARIAMITQMRRISLFLGGAGEVGGIVGVAGAFVFRDLRIGANRARKFHAARGIETGVLGGD
jgi:hypothetical protein